MQAVAIAFDFHLASLSGPHISRSLQKGPGSSRILHWRGKSKNSARERLSRSTRRASHWPQLHCLTGKRLRFQLKKEYGHQAALFALAFKAFATALGFASMTSSRTVGL